MINSVKLTGYTQEISQFINVVRNIVRYTDIIQFYQENILNINIEYFHIITTYSTRLCDIVCPVLL